MVTRITGIVSGLDTDTTVKKLMEAASAPLNKLKQKQQTLQWQEEAFRSINAQLLTFSNLLSSMKLSQSYRSKTTNSSNDALIAATASSGASNTAYSFSNVTQLATAATRMSNGSLSGTTKIDQTQSLVSQEDQFNAGSSFTWKEGSVESKTINADASGTSFDLGLTNVSLVNSAGTVDTSTMNVKVNGNAYKIVSNFDGGSNEVMVSSDGKLTFQDNIASGSSIKVDYVTDSKIESGTINKDASSFTLTKKQLASVSSLKIGTETYTNIASNGEVKDGSGNVVATIDKTAGKITLAQPVAEDTTIEANYTEKYSNFNIATHTSKGDKSQNFLIKGSDSLDDVFNNVNGSTVGVNMMYDAFSDKVTMTRTETGDFNTSGDETSVSGDFVNNLLHFSGSTETGGDNAKFTVNGLATERDSNTFTMNGVSFTLKDTFTSPTSISVKNDTDSVYNNIKNFVDQYNSLVDTVRGKLTEDKYTDYTPLTDDQKSSMSDTQIEQWETKAKSGLLKNDSNLTNTLANMRTLMYQTISGDNISSTYNSLSKIGITTTANFLDGGKLQIDDTKLKAALENDPTSVENLFRGSGTTSNGKGIMNRLYDSVQTSMTNIANKAGKSYYTKQQFTIGRNLVSLADQITRLQDKLDKQETRYYNQFGAMETAMQRANNQAGMLASYFS